MDLSRYTGRPSKNVEDDYSSDSKTFHLEKENQILFMLEFWLKSGIRFALPYDHITEIAFDANTGSEIIIGYPDRDIRLKGVHLEEIWSNLLLRKIKWIKETEKELDEEGHEKEASFPCIYEILNEKYEEN